MASTSSRNDRSTTCKANSPMAFLPWNYLMFAGQLGSIIKELLLAEYNAHGSPIDSIIHHLVSVSFPRSGYLPGFAPMCDLPSMSFCSVDWGTGNSFAACLFAFVPRTTAVQMAFIGSSVHWNRSLFAFSVNRILIYFMTVAWRFFLCLKECMQCQKRT